MKSKKVLVSFLITLMIISSFSLILFLDNSILTNEKSQKIPAIELVDDLPIQSEGIVSINEGSFNGTGDLISANKFGQISFSQQAIQTNSSFQVDIQDWNGTSINVNISNIGVSSRTTGELDLLTTTSLQTNYYFAQPFHIAAAYGMLNKIAVYMKFLAFTQTPPQDLVVRIYNAREPWAVKPDTMLVEEQFDIGTGNPLDYSDWLEVIFSAPIELNTSLTVNSTFFVALAKKGVTTNLEWWGASDSGMNTDGVDEFLVWESADGTNWVQMNFDFSLNTSLSGLAAPSQVYIAINGTPVNFNEATAGSCVFNFPEPRSGMLNFQVTANSTVILDVDGFLSIRKEEGFNSQFLIHSDWDYSKWNLTQDVSFFMSAINLGINISIPLWNAETVRLDGSEHSSWTITEKPNSRVISILNAANGIWTVECNASNYMEGVSLFKEGVQVSKVNITDTVEIYGNLSHNLNNGFANLTVYPEYEANYTDSTTNIIGNDTINFGSWEIMYYARTNPGSFRVQITWFNGTAVGLNFTTLSVQNIATNLTLLSHSQLVQSLESVIAYVNFSTKLTREPITGAILIVKNSTDDTIWYSEDNKPLYNIRNDYLNGTYQIEISTYGLGSGWYEVSINMSKNFYGSSQISNIQFLISGGLSNISVSRPGANGLISINQTFATVQQIPYHNSSVKVSLYYYINETRQPIDGALISGTWLGGGPEISSAPFIFGYYNVTIYVTGFHANTNHTLKLTVQKEGYVPAILYILVPIKKLPTRIQTEFPSYSKYLEEFLTVFAVYEDVFNQESIPDIYTLNGNFTIKIGNLVATMQLILPSIGLYKYDLELETLGLEEGKTYNMTLFAFSSEHELALLNVSLTIIAKDIVDLELLGVPSSILSGSECKIFANLMLNGTPLVNTQLKFEVIYGLQKYEYNVLTNGSGIAEIHVEINSGEGSVQFGVHYFGTTQIENKTIYSAIIPIRTLKSAITMSLLPHEILEGKAIEINATLLVDDKPAEGEILFFQFTFDDTTKGENVTAITNELGIASITYKIPSGVKKISVEVVYRGLVYVSGNSTQSEMSVITTITLIWRYAPIWLTLALAAVGTFLVYKFGYKRPKMKRLQSKWKISAQNYTDAMNLGYIMVILKNTGIAVFNYSFKGEEIDYQLMGGFLTAITTFQKELIKSDGRSVLDTGEWEISYQQFKIFAINRDYAQFILILEGKISETLKENMLRFAMDVERNFAQEFVKFRGDVSVFQPITSLVPQHFQREWLMRQYAKELTPMDRKRLSELERQIHNLGVFYTQEHGYFYVQNLLANAEQMLGIEKEKILSGIESLMEKKYFTTSRISMIID